MAILLLAVLLRLLLTPSATSQHSISLLTHHNHQHSTHHSNGNNIHGKQKLLTHENSLIASKAYERLTRSIDAYANGTELWGSTVFYDVVPSLKVPDSFVHPSDGKGEHSKYFIGVNALKKLGKEAIAYGFGIDNRPVFEKYLSTHFNTSVYGFDCTNSKKEDWDNYFEFHPWCLGRKKSFQGNIYSKNAPDNSNGSSFEFYSLKEIKKELGHQYVTVLKMDIEGFEWDILYQEIVHGDEEDLPELLLFELHTAGASRYFVPAEVVKGKGRREVTQLVKDLFDIGYRVTNIEINKGDLHCAEISLYKYR